MGVSAASAAGCLTISADGITVTGTDGTCTVVSAADFEGATIIADAGSGSGVFYNSRNILTSVTFPSSLTTIGGRAFDGCLNLTSVTFPSSLILIGERAFSSTGLTRVDLSDTSLINIGGRAFDGCSSLASVTFPSSLTTIGGSAFYGCTSLTHVDLSGTSLTSIEYSMFSNCTSLTSVTFPSSITIIRANAFTGCLSLTSVTFPSSLTSIEQSAFSNTGLTRVDLSDTSLTTILVASFYGCTSLTHVDLSGTSLTSIEAATFSGCTSLSSVILPSSLTSIGAQAFYDTALSSVDLSGTSLTSIGQKAFDGCSSLASVILPSSLTSIGSAAFNGSNANILFTNKTATVADGAFYNNNVYCYSDSAWINGTGHGNEIYLIDSISASDLTLDPGDTETITVTPNVAASASYIPSITWSSSNTSAATLTNASTAQGVMSNTVNGIADGTSAITITAAQVGSDIFGSAAVPAIDPITINVVVGTGVSNIPTTGGEGGVSGTQNGSDLAQYEAAVYAAPVVSANGNTALVITNTHYPELINVSVVKVWEDDDDRDHYRPDAICITLTAAANNVEEEVWNYSLSATNANASDANRWEYTFDDMVKFYDGYQIAYTLDEDSGSCTDQVTKTAANCEISGGKWENNACTAFSLYNPNSQQSSPATYNDQSSCETAGYTWVAASCSDNTYQDQSTCDANGETWTSAYCLTN